MAHFSTIRRASYGGQLSLFSPSPRAPAAREDAGPYAIPIYKVALVREAQLQVTSPGIRHSAQAAEIVRRYLGDVDREYFIVLLLDRKNRVIGINTVSVGSLTASVCHPRETFKPAIVGNAAAIVCAHNHPSGDPAPSAEDRALTTRLVEAGKLLGIQMLDHIIVGDGTMHHYSFADHGTLA